MTYDYRYGVSHTWVIDTLGKDKAMFDDPDKKLYYSLQEAESEGNLQYVLSNLMALQDTDDELKAQLDYHLEMAQSIQKTRAMLKSAYRTQ